MDKILLIICIIFWGISSFFDKMSLKYFSALQLKLLSAIFAIILIFLIYLFNYNESKIIYLNKLGLLYVFFSVVFGMIGALCLLFVLKNSNNTGSIIFFVNTYPVITTILSFLFLKEELSMFKLLGILIIILGGALLNL